MPVLLVRHAVALPREDWNGPDWLRPLDERGRRQALELVPLLCPFAPTAILTSRAVRCVDTVAPLAAALRAEVEVRDELFECAGEAAVALVRRLASGGSAVLCTHGDVLPLVLDGLAAAGMRGWNGSGRCEKGGTWVLDGDDRALLTARYLPPPA